VGKGKQPISTSGAIQDYQLAQLNWDRSCSVSPAEKRQLMENYNEKLLPNFDLEFNNISSTADRLASTTLLIPAVTALFQNALNMLAPAAIRVVERWYRPPG